MFLADGARDLAVRIRVAVTRGLAVEVSALAVGLTRLLVVAAAAGHVEADRRTAVDCRTAEESRPAGAQVRSRAERDRSALTGGSDLAG